MRKFLIKKEYKGYPVARYLKEVEGYSSRSMRNIDIFINNKKIKKTAKKLRYKDVLKVIEKKKEVNIKPIEMKLDIVYEDDFLLILNKAPNLLTHPTLNNEKTTLANGVIWYLKEKNEEFVPRFYNRLDMDTSGIIVIAKSGFAQGFLQNHGEVEKRYLTIVKGIVEEDEFDVEKSIGISEDGIKRIISEDGQYAKTSFKVIKRDDQSGITLVEAFLHTGRTHQIRVHLSSCGYPIIGDKLYGEEHDLVKRQLLHSYKIKFIHPDSKKVKELEIDLPEDFKLFF